MNLTLVDSPLPWTRQDQHWVFMKLTFYIYSYLAHRVMFP